MWSFLNFFGMMLACIIVGFFEGSTSLLAIGIMNGFVALYIKE